MHFFKNIGNKMWRHVQILKYRSTFIMESTTQRNMNGENLWNMMRDNNYINIEVYCTVRLSYLKISLL